VRPVAWTAEVVVMLVLIAFVVAALVAFVLWRTMTAGQDGPPLRPARRDTTPRRVTGPDDDPDFLRTLDERTRRREDPPA
jgi:uncharacterized iron-regulated membrane protein